MEGWHLQHDANDEEIGLEVAALAGPCPFGDVDAEEVVAKLHNIVNQIGGNAKQRHEGGHRQEHFPAKFSWNCFIGGTCHAIAGCTIETAEYGWLMTRHRISAIVTHMYSVIVCKQMELVAWKCR